MISRLHLASRDLADRLSAAGPQLQRGITLAIVQHVFRQVPIHNAGEVLDALRTERFGDSPLRRDLDWSANQAESAFQTLRVENDRATTDGGNPDLARQHATSRVARTFRTAHYALALDPDVAAQETIYEAAYATSSQEVSQLVSVLLDVPREPSEGYGAQPSYRVGQPT